MAVVCGEGDKVGLIKETARIVQCSDLQIPGMGRAREERQHAHVLHILKGYLGTFMKPGEGNHGVSWGREMSLAERRCHLVGSSQQSMNSSHGKELIFPLLVRLKLFWRALKLCFQSFLTPLKINEPFNWVFVTETWVEERQTMSRPDPSDLLEEAFCFVSFVGQISELGPGALPGSKG